MQKGLTLGFCVEEMGGGGERLEEMGLQGGAGGAGREAEGQALLPEDDVDAGRGLGIDFLKARNKTSRSSRHFSWHYREVTVNVSSG